MASDGGVSLFFGAANPDVVDVQLCDQQSITKLNDITKESRQATAIENLIGHQMRL